MNAEIISVGTELLLGQVVNLDTAIVAQELSGLGINLLYSAVVGDNVERLRHAVETAISRSGLLIMTGGLGPTTDDLTKETTAACAGKKLVLHQPSLERIQNYFNEKHVSENQEKQAWLPEGCHVFQNDNGTAPGCAFQAENGCTIIMLPGPPSELTPMLKNYVVPLSQGQPGVRHRLPQRAHLRPGGGPCGPDAGRFDGRPEPHPGPLRQGGRVLHARHRQGPHRGRRPTPCASPSLRNQAPGGGFCLQRGHRIPGGTGGRPC